MPSKKKTSLKSRLAEWKKNIPPIPSPKFKDHLEGSTAPTVEEFFRREMTPEEHREFFSAIPMLPPRPK